MGRKNKAISCTAVFTFCIAMLLDFSGVQEKAGKVFSLIEAFLPIIALTGSVAAFLWLSTEAYMWLPSNRKKKEMKSLVPMLEEIQSGCLIHRQ